MVGDKIATLYYTIIMGNKKLIILYVYDFLQQASEHNRHLLQKDILDGIVNVFGIKCDRRTINRNIKYLQEYGCKIIYEKDKGYFLKQKVKLF